jgi:hypothetical protein
MARLTTEAHRIWIIGALTIVLGLLGSWLADLGRTITPSPQTAAAGAGACPHGASCVSVPFPAWVTTGLTPAWKALISVGLVAVWIGLSYSLLRRPSTRT